MFRVEIIPHNVFQCWHRRIHHVVNSPLFSLFILEFALIVDYYDSSFINLMFHYERLSTDYQITQNADKSTCSVICI